MTYIVLSARRAYRLRDVSHKIDAHIVGPTGTRLPSCRPWSGSAQRSAVDHRGRHFEVRLGVRADEMLENVCWRVRSRYQEALEAKARGEDVRRPSEIAGTSEGCQAQKLAGRGHRDGECWPEAKGYKKLSNLRTDACRSCAMAREAPPTPWIVVQHVAFSRSLTAEKRASCAIQVVVVQYPQGWAAAFRVHFFQRGFLVDPVLETWFWCFGM